jgi:hypothetical protein
VLAEGPTDLNSLEDRLQAPPALIRQTVQMMLSENIILCRDKELYIEPK